MGLWIVMVIWGASAMKNYFDWPVVKNVLPNGMRVLILEYSKIPLVSYQTWFLVGSRDERIGHTGAAHMLEHMMFKGSEKYSGKDFDRILHEKGMVNNAFTSWDYTGYYENFHPRWLSLVMDIEVDRMKKLRLDPKDLASEKQVVLEERRWRIDNNPQGTLREKLFDMIFQNTPYQWPVIGYQRDIQSYTPEILRQFHETYYVPNNAVLVIAGDVKAQEVLPLVEKYYSDLPNKPIETRNWLKLKEKPVTRIPEKKYVEIRKKVQTRTYLWAVLGASVHDPKSVALDALAGVLGRGLSSRLSRVLYYEKGWVNQVSCFHLSADAIGLFGCYFVLKPKVEWKAVHDLFWRQVENIQSQGISVEEFDREKLQIQKEFLDGLDTLEERARTLAYYELIHGSYEAINQQWQRYMSLTVNDLITAAREFLQPSKEVVVALLPEGDN